MKRSIVAVCALGFSAVACGPINNVITQHINNYRNGSYLFESTLTPTNVHANFGRLYERNIDGQTLANPLLVQNVKLTDGSTKTLFFAATAKNCVYAFDLNDSSADSAPPPADNECSNNNSVDLTYRDPAGHCNVSTKAIWTRDLGPAGCADVCAETWPKRVGVTSTPVIDDTNGWMFVVSYHVDTRQHYLHKIDIRTGLDTQTPVLIAGSASGKTFHAACQRNRPGLLLQGGNVYVGFATFQCDQWCSSTDPYRGWIIGYKASDLTPAGAYTTSADGGMAGIWQSGNGLVGDGSNIYFMTGNEQPPTARGDSFVRVATTSTTIADAGFLQPTNHERLRLGDTDLGSSGPTYLPGGMILGGGKEGRLHLMDSGMTSIVQNWVAFVNTWHNDSSKPLCDFSAWGNDPTNNACYIPQDKYQDSEHWGPNIHSGPIYWKSSSDSNHGFVYLMPEKDYLKQFRYDLTTNRMETTPNHTSTERPPDGMPGGALSLSAAIDTNGIVWANVPNQNGQWFGPVGGHMVAFNAEDLSIIYRDDDQVAFAKFNPPIAAAGHVIRPTFANNVVVYGLLPPAPGKKIVGNRFLQPVRPPLGDPALAACYTIADKYRAYGGNAVYKPVGEEQKIEDGKGTIHRYTFSESLAGSCVAPQTVKQVALQAAIVASPDTCAHLVRGPILSYWEQEGAQKSKLGYPLTDELPLAEGGVHQYFEHGEVAWTALGGVTLRGEKQTDSPLR